jgi:hypothetical protein
LRIGRDVLSSSSFELDPTQKKVAGSAASAFGAECVDSAAELSADGAHFCLSAYPASLTLIEAKNFARTQAIFS